MRRQSTCLRLMELQGGRSTAVVSRQARPCYRLRPRRCRTRSGRLKGMSASASCLQRRLRCLQHSRRSMPLEMTPHEQRWPRRTGKRSERATTTICATTRTAAQTRPTVDNINRRPRMCAACVHMGRRGKGDHAAHMLPRCISGDALLSKLIPLAANEAGVRGAEQGSGGWAVESVHLPQSLGLATPASRSGA